MTTPDSHPIASDAPATELAAIHDDTADAAQDAVLAYSDQLVDRGEQLWHEEGRQVLTGQAANAIRVETAIATTTDLHSVIEQNLEEAMQDLAAAEASTDRARADRDLLIRAALEQGMTYAHLRTITNLSRAMLDAIRRGRTRLG